MTRLRLCLATTALVLAAPLAMAQPTPSGPGLGGEELEEWANDLDRPLARALAFERRDVIEEILLRPSSLGAATPAELAREASIPLRHAETIVNSVRASGQPAPTSLAALLKLGVPNGYAGPTEGLARASEGKLVQMGMTEAEAREFSRYRKSAQRTHQHFREIKAIHEARTRGAEATHERARRFRSASMGDRARMIAEGLGLRVGAENPEAIRARTRARLLEGSAEVGARDAFAPFRRADGTLDWKKMTRSEVFRGAGGVAHFGFALFLKELAVVLHTGDRARMEAFVDGLMSTDFFVNYGLFSAGARAADAVYGRYVRRLTRKRFLHGVMRSHLVLAAGLAVPMLVRGQFSLDTFLVDVAALGLSATAVKAAAEGAKGVYRLVRGGRTALSLGRLAGPVGWIYSAGETAVVLLMGDYLAKTFDEYLSERELTKRIKTAEGYLNRLIAKINGGASVDDREVAEAVANVEDAYNDMRRHRATPMEARVGRFREDLNDASRASLTNDAEMDALASRLSANPNLASHFSERYGSVGAFLSALRGEREARVESLLRESSESFNRDWDGVIRESYVGETSAEDPAPEPGSRMALYDEETSNLLRALDGTTDPVARRHIALAIERVRLGRAIDRSVYESATGTAPTATPPAPAGDSGGLSGALNANQ